MSGSNPKPWDRGGRVLGRREPTQPRRRVLVMCEDTKSAVYYLRAFPIDPTRVDYRPVGTGHNTDSLVQMAVDAKREAQRQRQPFNEVFCLFDRDSFPAQSFNRAFVLARNHGIHAIWANEAFELWYLLHFDFICTGISRDRYQPMLAEAKRLGGYAKNDPTIYTRLIDRQPIALKLARRLTKHWIVQGGCNPLSCNPSTNVDKLVIFLNRLAELGAVGPA